MTTAGIPRTDPDARTAPEMSVATSNLKEENEVSTMTMTTVPARAEAPSKTVVTIQTPSVRSSADYTSAERFVAAIALAMLRWSNRRADRLQPTHDRMQLLREVQRSTPCGGSQLAR